MVCATSLTAIVEALRSAGATEEIIVAAIKASGDLGFPSAGAAAGRASMPMVLRARERGAGRNEIRDEIATPHAPRDVTRVAGNTSPACRRRRPVASGGRFQTVRPRP
jgi:hypothetical protein